MVAAESKSETSESDEREDDDKPLTEEERQKLFEAAKSALTRTS